MALSADGNTALIGAEGNHEGVGGAFVFTRSGSTWSQQGGELSAKSPEELGAGNFGVSVALATGTGNTALIGGDGDHEGDRRGVGVHALGHRSGPSRARSSSQKPGRDGAGEFGDERGALLRRQHRAAGRPGRQHERRRGVGVHALGLDLDSAGRKADRQKSGRGRRRLIRLQRRAVLRRQHRADRRSQRQLEGRRGVGVREHRPDRRDESGVGRSRRPPPR